MISRCLISPWKMKNTPTRNATKPTMSTPYRRKNHPRSRRFVIALHAPHLAATAGAGAGRALLELDRLDLPDPFRLGLLGLELRMVVLRVDHPQRALVDRKSVVWGKSVAVRVDLGGRRCIKKKNNTNR